MELGKIIATNLNELRTERNLTLGQLSKISGISKAMLSDIEKGDSNPTINTIWKIANGLNVPYTRLMENIEKEATVIRKSEPTVQTGETEHYRIYCYFTNTLSEILNCFTSNWTPIPLMQRLAIPKRRRNIFTLFKVSLYYTPKREIIH